MRIPHGRTHAQLVLFFRMAPPCPDLFIAFLAFLGFQDELWIRLFTITHTGVPFAFTSLHQRMGM